MLAVDSETTGNDLHHGCKPFYVSTCSVDGQLKFWEWEVDPLTRTPLVPREQKQEVQELVDSASSLVLHNTKFDYRALESIGIDISSLWDKTEDTLIASHCLRNLWPHGLKELADIFFHISQDDQEQLRIATNHARRICRSKKFQKEVGVWRIAEVGDEHFPGLTRPPKVGFWVFDTWLPRAIALYAPEFLPKEENNVQDYKDSERGKETTRGGKRSSTDCRKTLPISNRQTVRVDHSWFIVLSCYAIRDAERTILIWLAIKEGLEEEGLIDQYEWRKRLLQPIYEMESIGVPLRKVSLSREIDRCQTYAEYHYASALETVITYRAKDQSAKTPNLNSSKQLQTILFENFSEKPIKKTKTGGNSTDEETLKALSRNCSNSTAVFLNDLLAYKRNSKAVDYLKSYKRWSVNGKPNRRTLHPSTNITGTRFTRQSMNNPNLQNVGTGKENEEGDIENNLRVCFGPPKGYVWLDYDYSNIELRIWAYSTGNEELIEAFEKGDSVHLVIARELHPKLQEMIDDEAKETKEYKRTKNGNFSALYGASPKKANLTYGVKNAYQRIVGRFPEIRSFTNYLHSQVMGRGYIETLGGYRLHIPTGEPHKAVSGFVQGTAGEAIGRAMVGCYEYLKEHPEANTDMILQVHDELVFSAQEEVADEIIRDLKRIMEEQGERIGIPTPVECKVCTKNWSEGERV